MNVLNQDYRPTIIIDLWVADARRQSTKIKEDPQKNEKKRLTFDGWKPKLLNLGSLSIFWAKSFPYNYYNKKRPTSFLYIKVHRKIGLLLILAYNKVAYYSHAESSSHPFIPSRFGKIENWTYTDNCSCSYEATNADTAVTLAVW
jgi:hypothetical protein